MTRHSIGPDASTLIQEVVVAMTAGSGTVQDIRESVHIHPALSEVVTSCWANVETDDATLRTDLHRTVQADRNRLTQVLENLRRNAVEHGGTGVRVTIGELDDGFSVEDDGGGIAPGDREQVQEDGHSSQQDGTGFGLTIVTQAAEAHGWAVRLTDGPDGGARFEITGVDWADS